MCMLFHKKLGVTPYKMLWNFRMRKACELLSKEKICIGEVARSVGYDGQLVFSKAFRKYNGRSPTEFRNKSIEI
ncbi:MAG TPA: hypothetical protein DCY35_07325 [Prolixibacteraceae bacterium]|nr:hypothetical protein [Prolixibacteraceae bacterium]